jgi:5-formyltetrahydrofolate cyclo-ligase
LNSPDAAQRAADRQALRRAQRERRRQLPAAERIAAAEAIAQHLRPRLHGREGFIGGYWAIGGEVLLHRVQATLPDTLGWCLPLLHGDQRLRFARWSTGDALNPNRFGIPEPVAPNTAQLLPEEMSVVLLPLLAFDGHGQRLGMGGGWYDRSFAFRRQRPGRPWLVGVAYGWQRVPAVVAEDWDVPLDAVVTEQGFQEFR